MTTFVLHGGATSNQSSNNDVFFDSFSTLTDKPEVHCLMCYWARPKTQWKSLLTRDKTHALAQAHKKLTFEIVSDPDDLNRKLQQTDVLFVAGGDAEPIERYYSKLTDLKEMLNGKVYLGSSMGAFMVAKQYVLSFDSQDNKTVHKGLDILPINVLCHWDVEDKKEHKLKLLKKTDPKTPILTLKETELATFVI